MRLETRETAMLLRNIIFFELDNDLEFTREKDLETKTKLSTLFYRFEYELNKTLRHLNKLNKKTDKHIIKDELKELFVKLQQFEKQSPIKGIEGLQETKLWLQSRVTGVPMTQIMFPT